MPVKEEAVESLELIQQGPTLAWPVRWGVRMKECYQFLEASWQFIAA
jgi:hypothetical protein